MAPTIRIPDGFVFFRKFPGLAAGLLEAADAVGGDRKLDVRTVNGGYHVSQKVAEKYQSKYGKVEEAAEAAETTGESPDESWTVADIDEWAAKQVPPVEFPSDATKKADKLAFLNTPAE